MTPVGDTVHLAHVLLRQSRLTPRYTLGATPCCRDWQAAPAAIDRGPAIEIPHVALVKKTI